MNETESSQSSHIFLVISSDFSNLDRKSTVIGLLDDNVASFFLLNSMFFSHLQNFINLRLLTLPNC